MQDNNNNRAIKRPTPTPVRRTIDEAATRRPGDAPVKQEYMVPVSSAFPAQVKTTAPVRKAGSSNFDQELEAALVPYGDRQKDSYGHQWIGRNREEWIDHTCRE